MSNPDPPPALPPSAWGAPPEPSMKGPLAATIVVAIFLGLIVGLGVIVLRSGLLEPGIAAGPAPVPTGRANLVPPALPGKTLYLARLDGTTDADIAELARFYGERYGINVNLLPAASITQEAWDARRSQLVGEDAMVALVDIYETTLVDRGAVVIGVADEDLYLRSRPDWRWAFGIRSGDDRVAVVSTWRMALPPGVDASLRMSRLRKMVGRDIGFMYFGLPASGDPGSMLHRDLLGVDDLDRMGEEF